jgi:hypothetical protein
VLYFRQLAERVGPSGVGVRCGPGRSASPSPPRHAGRFLSVEPAGGQFLALLVGALMEIQIRNAMRQAQTSDIPLYPELRACEAPSAERILAVFADPTRHELHRDGRLVQTFEAELTPLQQQILDLLDVPDTAYTAN